MLFGFKAPTLLQRVGQLTQLPVRYRRRGISFRKRLGVYSFKIKKRQYYKNPHAMKLSKRELFKKSDEYSVQKITETERDSIRPFGSFTQFGNFKFNIDHVPFYNVPDLKGFKLKPYVAHSTPKVPNDIFEPRIDQLPSNVLKLKLAPEVTTPATPEDAGMAEKR